MTATKTRTATVVLSPVVNYHGTLANKHGLWRVVQNYGSALMLRDSVGNKLRCRPVSITIVEMPRFTEARMEALHTLRNSPVGRLAAGKVRTWLLANGLIEADVERSDEFRATELGAIADEAAQPFYYGGMPARLSVAGPVRGR